MKLWTYLKRVLAGDCTGCGRALKLMASMGAYDPPNAYCDNPDCPKGYGRVGLQ